MTKGRQPLNGGACTISVILSRPQREQLMRRVAQQREKLGRHVSASEVVRQAIDLYLAADSFFAKRIA